MAVYKIFPEKTATMVSEFNTMNTGLSEIIDLSKNQSLTYPSYSAVGRGLIKFSNTDINYVVSNYIVSSSYSASLKLYLADASAIPADFTIDCFAVEGAWDVGTGRLDDVPMVTDGVSWVYQTANNSPWPVTFSGGSTGSYFAANPGGGQWWSSSTLHTSQSFQNNSNLDLNIDVTQAVQFFVEPAIENDGFVLVNNYNDEFDASYLYTLQYFSAETNTIYPPSLDLAWDDSVYTPNTSSMTPIQSSNVVVTVGNNQGSYDPEAVQRFNINVREQYPVRSFVTSSIYTVGEYLPATSYWRLRDYDTGNIIFDFDTNFTKISTDQNGSFFTLYMNGMEPERYYRIEIRVDYQGQSMIFDNDYYFKVNR
jgi:hypothetical protein